MRITPSFPTQGARKPGTHSKPPGAPRVLVVTQVVEQDWIGSRAGPTVCAKPVAAGVALDLERGLLGQFLARKASFPLDLCVGTIGLL